MWQSFGHTTIKQLLDKQLQRQALAHAYLFVGPPGVGKKMVAEDMARQILHTQRLDTHPDYIYYDAANDLGIEGLRQFLQQLANKPFIGQHKVAVIDNMDQANVQMSNALLKTLEEPSPSTTLFVIAGQNNLLPTIISRCQVLTFSALSQPELTEFAHARQLQVSHKDLAASFGSPSRLLFLVNDPETAGAIDVAVSRLSEAETGSTSEKLLAINDLAELEADQLKSILLVWLYQLRQQLSANPMQAALMSRLCEALSHLNGSFNKKMVLQRLLLPAYEMA